MLEVAITAVVMDAVSIHIVQIAVIAPERSTKIRRCRERDGGRHNMAHHLQLLTEFTQEFQWFEETINFGTQRDAEVEIKDVIETIGGVLDHSTGIGVPLLAYLAGIHTVVKGYRGCDVKILHHIEGRLDGHSVAHAVAPILNQALMQEFILLSRQRILEAATVTDLNLLIPLLVTHSMFALEWCRLAHVDRQIGE